MAVIKSIWLYNCILVTFWSLHFIHIDCLPPIIRIGGLFSTDEEEQELVFRFAVDRINADTTILPRSTLIAQVERIGKEDSFHADKKGKQNPDPRSQIDY